ncbi:MAG: substrate-binding domain-containing protein [Vicinamibacterales bacterium]
MLMIWRRVTLAVLFALIVAAGASCGSSSPTKRTRPLVGVSLLTQTHAFYKELEDALRAEAQVRGIDLVVVACEMDPARQAAQMEDFVTQKVDAILAAPCDSNAIVPYLKKAEEAHIPVFTADIAARGGTVVSHIASDNYEGGRLAARTLAQLIGGRGNVVIIDHPEVASVQDRTRGFEEALRAYPEVKIVGRPSASGQRAKAMAVAEDMLQANKKLNGIFAINDDSALGALAVLEAAKRSDVVIVGFDATPEAQEAIRRGSALKADIMQHPGDIGRMAIETIAGHLAGRSVESIVAVPVNVVTAETLAAAAAPATPPAPAPAR